MSLLNKINNIIPILYDTHDAKCNAFLMTPFFLVRLQEISCAYKATQVSERAWAAIRHISEW